MGERTVVIRPARRDESDLVAAAYAWLFAPPGRPVPGWDERRAAGDRRALIARPSATVLVAVEGDELVGFCTAELDLRSVRFGRRAWVEDLAVRSDRRSSGIGKRLLDAAKGWSREHGASHLELDSGDARHDAHRFYERERPSWTSRSFGWQL
ncbi:MAG: N-acetyltransferase family protein [Nocardioidaceae bacterium]